MSVALPTVLEYTELIPQLSNTGLFVAPGDMSCRIITAHLFMVFEIQQNVHLRPKYSRGSLLQILTKVYLWGWFTLHDEFT